MELLERNGELQVLRGAVAGAADGRGSVVLVAGEAGIGKSMLLDVFAADPGSEARVLVGWCDDLLTSRTYAPLRDIARAGDGLAAAIADGDTAAVTEEVFALLEDPLRPTVMILEDLHWADEATLDVVRLVGRRIQDRPAVLVLSYRAADSGGDHPLRGVLAALPPRATHRLHPRPLSRAAVAELVAGSRLDADEVMALTGGNPFFVSEVAAQGTLPESVTDAVLARLQPLDATTVEAVELLSVVPRGLDRAAAVELVGGPEPFVDAEGRGLLVVDDTSVGFRHELARRAVFSALPVTTRVRHHDRVLDYLLAHDAESANIIHHAVGAGRADVVASHGPRAVHHAFAAGSNREAAAHARQVLSYGHLLEDADRAAVLLDQTWALYALGRFPEAQAAAEHALEIRARTGPVDQHARALVAAARMAYTMNEPARVAELLALVADLDRDGMGREVAAEAAVNRTGLYQLTGASEKALDAATEAVELLEGVDRPDLRLLATMYRGGARLSLGDLGGLDELRSVLGTEVTTATIEPIGRAYSNTVTSLVELRQWDEALRTSEEALEFFADHDLDGHRYNMLGTVAWLHLFQGRWDVSRDIMRSIELREEGIFAVGSLIAESMIAIRRGEPDARKRFDAVSKPALRSGSPWLVIPAACAGVEAAWAADDHEAAEPYVRAGLAAEDALQRGWLQWRLHVLLGHDVDPAGMVPSAERTSVEQGWERGAEAWDDAGMPYEQALELIRSGEVDPTMEGLAILDGLGAEPAARIARQRLRELGVASVPRGPQASTRENPMGLTDRQLEVLELLAEGLTNAEIADRLVVSVRTVDHHVSAVLQKLGVDNRQEAADVAATLSGG